MIIDLQKYQLVKNADKTPNGSHIPEVDGSNPLPPTSTNKGLQVVSCTPFLFGVKMVSWVLEGVA